MCVSISHVLETKQDVTVFNYYWKEMWVYILETYLWGSSS